MKQNKINQLDSELTNSNSKIRYLVLENQKQKSKITNFENSINDLNDKLKNYEKEDAKIVKLKEHILQNMKTASLDNHKFEEGIEGYKNQIKDAKEEINNINNKLAVNKKKNRYPY